MKSIRSVLSLALALVLVLCLCPAAAGVQAAEATTRVTLDGYYNYTMANDLLSQINDLRLEAGMEPVKMDASLAVSARQRSVENFLYHGSTRPDGSPLVSALAPELQSGFLTEISLYQANATRLTAVTLNRAQFLSEEIRSVGIACFGQSADEASIVFILHSGECTSESTLKGKMPAYGAPVDILPRFLTAWIAYPVFDPEFCDMMAHFYPDMEFGIQFFLAPNGAKDRQVEVKHCDYAITSSKPDVISVDNENHIFRTHQPGTTDLSVLIGGETVNFYAKARTLMVDPMFELHYEINEAGVIRVDLSGVYHGVYSDLNLDRYQNGGEWVYTAAVREYLDYHVGENETVMYVMRYYDQVLNRIMEVGPRLIIQRGDEALDLPDQIPDYDAYDPLPVPDPSELPIWEEEPELNHVEDQLQKMIDSGTILNHSSTDTYSWAAGDVTLTEGIILTEGEAEACMPMIFSDRIFGTLPARPLYDVTVDDLRYGDLVALTDGRWGIITNISRDYVVMGLSELSHDAKSCYFYWNQGFTPEEFSNLVMFALTRYESDSPGADVLMPPLVPEGTRFVASGTGTQQLAKWLLAEDGTIYLYGYGQFGDLADFSGGRTEPWGPYADQIRRVVAGQDIIQIGSRDFAKCLNLEEVILGDEIQTIWEEAFSGCTALKTVVLGSGLQSIGAGAFSSCTALEEITLPDQLTVLKNDLFSRCTSLKTVNLPGNLKSLGERVFAYTDALETVVFPEGLTELGAYLFWESGLREITIPEGIAEIPYNAFYRCLNLETVTLPVSLTKVDREAFYQCDGITDIYYNGTLQQYDRVFTVNVSMNDPLNRRWSDATFHFLGGCAHENTSVRTGYAPKCEIPGQSDGLYCNDCKTMVEEQVELPALGHRYGQWYETTGSEVGPYLRRDCTACDDHFEAEVDGIVYSGVRARGIPNCTESGGISDYCKEGNRLVIELDVLEFEPPLGHDFVGGYCSRCGWSREEAETDRPFADVPAGQWYTDPVLWAVEKGITSGTSASTFSPGKTCTRGQVVTFLWRAKGEPEPTLTENPFSDVKAGDYFYKAVLWAVENGITSGVSKTTFAPNNPCTRAQVVTFLWRTMGNPAPEKSDNPFTDVPAGQWYTSPVLWAVENGITSGTSKTTFAPNNPCTRAQVVTFLYRTLKDK